MRRFTLVAFSAVSLVVFGVGSAPAAGDPALTDSSGAATRLAPPWKPFRFHPGPRSQCGTFALTELALLRRFGNDARVVQSSERYYYSFDLGLEHNVSDATALGGSVFVGMDNARGQFGVRARARRWLSKSASVDLAPGLILAGTEEKDADFLGPALVLRAGLNLSATVGVTAQTFETRRRKSYGVDKERATYVGAQLNSKAGSVGLGLVLAVAIVYFSFALSNSSWF